MTSDSVLPYFETGPVVKGFGRGSKEIGIPTGRYSSHALQTLALSLSYLATRVRSYSYKSLLRYNVLAANYPASVVERLPPQLESGVYYGWAQVEAGPVYPMVMSIGWNPHFQNKERSMVREGGRGVREGGRERERGEGGREREGGREGGRERMGGEGEEERERERLQ